MAADETMHAHDDVGTMNAPTSERYASVAEQQHDDANAAWNLAGMHHQEEPLLDPIPLNRLPMQRAETEAFPPPAFYPDAIHEYESDVAHLSEYMEEHPPSLPLEPAPPPEHEQEEQQNSTSIDPQIDSLLMDLLKDDDPLGNIQGE